MASESTDIVDEDQTPAHEADSAVPEADATTDSADAESAEPAPAPPRRFERTVGTMTVAVTGATGFVGSHICEALGQHGHKVRALTRSTKSARSLPRSAEAVIGDLDNRAALDSLVAKADVCIHLVGIIAQDSSKGATFEKVHVEGTRHIVEACQDAGILRYVHMSALGARANAPSLYHRTKHQAEMIVRASNLAWTIFRPSMIVGPDGEFAEMVAKWVRGKAPPFFFMPYFGEGPMGQGRRYLIQPVDVRDVAELFVRAFETQASVREVYPLGGPDAMTWPEMFYHFRDTIAPGSSKKAIAIPAWKALAMARAARFMGLEHVLPFNVDQVHMSQEDSTCSNARIHTDFVYQLRPLDEALASYASRL